MKPVLFFIFRMFFRMLCIGALLSTSVAGIAQKKFLPNHALNSLNSQIRMNVLKETKHVGEAYLYVLGATPYKLALGYPASNSASVIATQPIPPGAFEGEVMTIAEALLMLIGEDNQLLIDPDHYFISFERIHLHNKTGKEVI